jgi:hypothetical protein
MDVDRLPGWLKALAASLWVTFVLAPLILWLMHRFGDVAVWIAPAALAAVFVTFHSRFSDEDIPDAEYYRRKARNLKATTE